MAKKQKYYVVWQGTEPGIYRTWEECKERTEGFPGAKYKTFATEEEAEEAFYSGEVAFKALPAEGMENGGATADDPKVRAKNVSASKKTVSAAAPVTEAVSPREGAVPALPPALPKEVERNAIAVDASCLGNPGMMEYRGVDLETGEVMFHFGPIFGTNNIGEFLAIVHALALLQQRGEKRCIYSDSRNALLWVRNRKCRTTLGASPRAAQALNMVQRAETWLQTHSYADIKLLKWQTDKWGEVPADFGRK